MIVGGVFTKGNELKDILGLDRDVVGSRYVSAAKEDIDGVVYNGNNGATLLNEEYADYTCDDITGSNIEVIFNYYENVGGQATIEFPSNGCGELDVKRCRKNKDCKWMKDEEKCVSKDDDGGGNGGIGLFGSHALVNEEKPMTKESNSAHHAEWKMMLVGFFLDCGSKIICVEVL